MSVTARWAGGVVALAFAARLACWWAATAEPRRFFHAPDSSEYERLALNLLSHARFSLDDGPPFAPDHTRTPVYPVVLAGLYAVTGPRPAAGALLNVLAATASVAALVVVGGRLAGPAPALLAGGLLAVDPTSVGYSVLLLTESLFTLLLVLGLLAATTALKASPIGPAVRSGIWLGLAALTRPIGVYLPLLLGGALAVRSRRGGRRGVSGAVALLVASALLTTPWALRNLRTGGLFELSSVGGLTLYYHRAAAVVADAVGTSRATVRRELEARLRAAAEAGGLSDASTRRLMTTWATGIILADLPRYARLHLEGLGRMLGPSPEPVFHALGWLGPGLRPSPDRETYWKGAVALEGFFLGGLYLAGLSGVWRAARVKRGWLVLPAALTVAYALLTGGPEVYPRFRVPLMPCFAWLAGLGLTSVGAGDSAWAEGARAEGARGARGAGGEG